MRFLPPGRHATGRVPRRPSELRFSQERQQFAQRNHRSAARVRDMSEPMSESSAAVGKWTRFVTDFLASDIKHRLRGSVLEDAVRLESAINEVLAVRLAGSVTSSYELEGNVLSRLPVDVRLEMLDRHMNDSGAEELWPLLVPALRKIFDLRNRYAHGHVSTLRDGGIQVVSWNRGRRAEATYSPDQITWLAYEAHIASIDLARLWAFWIPADAAWHGVDGD